MNVTEEAIKESAFVSSSRSDLWCRLLELGSVKCMAEVGVYKGDYASEVLARCDSIEKYYMIDPWRHLVHWNKPANMGDETFERYLAEAMSRTEFASQKRVVLRGTTVDVIGEIADGELDFLYIDGDHTLRGIAIDLIRGYEKVRVGGWIGGDDFSQTVWQHRTTFEPTLVFPFAVYFAEAVGACLYALPYEQFLIEKGSGQSFSFVDLTGRYSDLSLRAHFHPNVLLKVRLNEMFSFPFRFLRQVKRLLVK